MNTLAPLSVLALLAAATPASAAYTDTGTETETPTDEWRVTAGVGVLAHPKYSGSDETKFDPAPFVAASYGRWMFGAAPGTGLPFGAAYNFVQTPSFRVGVALGGTFVKARKESDDARLAGLGDIDGTGRAATYASYTIKWFTARASASTDIGGKNQGTLANFDLEARFEPVDRLSVTIGPGLTWGDQKYMQTFFGIDALQSANSGRAEYTPGAGMLNAHLGLGVDYSITSKWGLGARMSFIQLQGNAADSPITESRRQDTVAAFLTYRF